MKFLKINHWIKVTEFVILYFFFTLRPFHIFWQQLKVNVWRFIRIQLINHFDRSGRAATVTVNKQLVYNIFQLGGTHETQGDDGAKAKREEAQWRKQRKAETIMQVSHTHTHTHTHKNKVNYDRFIMWLSSVYSTAAAGVPVVTRMLVRTGTERADANANAKRKTQNAKRPKDVGGRTRRPTRRPLPMGQELKSDWLSALFNEKNCPLASYCTFHQKMSLIGILLKKLKSYAYIVHKKCLCCISFRVLFFWAEVSFFTHLSFFKWLYWSFNPMYHQIYYTGWSVTHRTTPDGHQPIHRYTETKSVLFFFKVRKLVRPPQCHLFKYLLIHHEHTDPLFFFVYFLLPVV